MKTVRILLVSIFLVSACREPAWGGNDGDTPLAEAVRQEGGSIFCLRTPRFPEYVHVLKDGSGLISFDITDICRLDVATGAVVVLTKKPLPVREISPAPDGQAVAFLSKGDNTSDVFVLDCQTGLVTNLTKGVGNALLPAWSPDGKQIAFVSDRVGDWRVFVMAPDGAGVQQVGDWNAMNVLQNLDIQPGAVRWGMRSLHWMSDARRLLIKLNVGTAEQPSMKYVGRILTVGRGDMQEGTAPPPRDGVLSHDDRWFVSSYWGPSRLWRNNASIGADWRTTALFISEITDVTKKRLLYDGGPKVWCSSPAWSPSDEMVVFEWGEERRSLQPLLKRGDTEHPWVTEVALAVVSVRSGRFERLTDARDYDWREPQWVRKNP